MKNTLILLGIFTLAIGGYAQSKKDVQPDKRPNIIYLMADDQSTYSVGIYGNKEVMTPNMDKLGMDGLIFDRHYNTTAICMASRATVLTGMYEYKTGTNFFHGDMHPEVWEKSYPVLLREAGYLTAFAGKFGIKVDSKGICEEDFDIWGGAPGQSSYTTLENESMAGYAEKYPHSTLSYGAFGQDVIRAAAKQNKPFSLSISFKAPHKPADPDPMFDAIYQDKVFTKPGNFGREYAKYLSEQSKGGRQYPRFTEWHYDTDYDREMRKYHQQVYAIDVAIGMIREELERQGMDKNTVIIYTSDNGYISGSHGYASKVLPMEESSRVPLMIYDPRSKSAGKKFRSQSLTGNIDFAPTILDLAGLPVPKNMDGASLVPLIENPKKEVHDQMAFMNVFGPIMTHSLTCLTSQWKYTYWWYKDEKMDPVEELFDVKNDPLELKNYASDPQFKSELEMMRKKYAKEVEQWKKESVSYNDYTRYGVLFDRSVPWEAKEKLLEK
ncbi:acetylglucosamine-6-sulfatase [Echinicola pacifica]|uniref:Acetylglucosamine-6-sulfatase n=1 Tax=Echinicola pacifica TaxID=346377 RepID=A0A918PNP7_9BACT|nr:sulfatase [Echinicola pacifica]GGZ17067.1 acetylglucosamine-6-sulfatase [Echinicola pacifica]